MTAFKQPPSAKEQTAKPKVELFADPKPQFRLKPTVNHIDVVSVAKDEEHKFSRSNTR